MHHLQRSPCRLQKNGTGISVNVRTVTDFFLKNFDLYRERLLNVNLSSVDVRTRQEVHMFLTAIEKNPPVMNLNGYANINRKLISSVSRLTAKESPTLPVFLIVKIMLIYTENQNFSTD